MSESKIVVYVDDEPALCRVFEMVVEGLGADVATFTDPRAALAFIQENDVAVVICDYRMPRVSGLDVLARIGRSVPFYLVSGDFDASAAAGVPGITEVLQKPFRAEELISIVRRHAC